MPVERQVVNAAMLLLFGAALWVQVMEERGRGRRQGSEEEGRGDPGGDVLLGGF